MTGDVRLTDYYLEMYFFIAAYLSSHAILIILSGIKMQIFSI